MSLRYGFLLLLLLQGCGGDPTATDPKLLYEDAFLTPLSEVEILAEGGTMVRGLDGWLKLAPKVSQIEPRKPESYEFIDCEEPLAWFREATGDTGLASGYSGIVCQRAVEKRFDFNNGRWLVSDRNRGLVFYRIWKKYQ